jgi:hypothetical protein
MTQGEDFVMKVQLMQPDKVTPVDLTDCELKAQIRDKVNGTIYADLTNLLLTGGLIFVGLPSLGTFKMSISKVATILFPTKTLKWDFFITDALGETHPYFVGDVTVTAAITKPSA